MENNAVLSKRMLSNKKLTSFDWFAGYLVLFGAINWIFIGLFNFDFIRLLSFNSPFIIKMVYALIELAGVWVIYRAYRCCRNKNNG
jgi:uncharacterized membrane protein YuzA (DUF378 family)